MTETKTITAEEAETLHQSEPGTTAGPWTYVDQQHVRTRRWSEQYYLVVMDSDGQHWGLAFDEPLTEMQETEWPWENKPDDAPLSLVRLYAHEVRTVEYRKEPA